MKGETKIDRKGSEKLLEAIGGLPEEMVAEAADPEKLRRLYQKNRRRQFLSVGRGLAAAAVIGIVVWGVYVKVGIPLLGQTKGGGLAEKQEMVQLESDSVKTGGSDSAESEGNRWSESSMGGEGASEKFGIYFPSPEREGESAAEYFTHDGKDTETERTKSVEEKAAEEKVDITSGGDASADGSNSTAGQDASTDGNHVQEQSVFSIDTSISEEGKKRRVQSELILGEAGERKKYHLTASKGISFLMAASLNKKGEITNKRKDLKETRRYQCVSGTQITISLPAQGNTDTDLTEGIPAQILASWKELEIQTVGYIKVYVGEGAEKEKSIKILVGKRKKNYYAQFLE